MVYTKDMNDFYAQKNKDYTLKLRELVKTLPPFAEYYFRGKESQTSVLTRYAYAVDLQGFFTFVVKELPAFHERELLSLTLQDLEKITPLDIEQYLSYVSLYERNDTERENSEKAKARKLSAIRSFFKYYHKKGMISQNPAALVDAPKLHEKAIVRLEANEVADLLDIAEDGQGLTKRQQKYRKATGMQLRDSAILTLFLGTGIRITELVGINMEEVNFNANTFLVTRKGGSQEQLSFGSEVKDALWAYYQQRKTIIPAEGHEKALFLSSQRKRITPRAVEYLVEKYARIASPLKKITPHKLRSTYGSMLYQESGDIYLVADVLGHKDVNTTRKHYAAQKEREYRMASRYIKLREEGDEDTPPSLDS